MTRTKACQILGIAIDADMTEIKKIYRQLMHQVHPDTDAFHTIEYAYTAQEINEAYDFLCKISTKGTDSFRNTTRTGNASPTPPKKKRWNAPLNPTAYTERNIYHYVEDCDCSIIGSIILDTGKFL